MMQRTPQPLEPLSLSGLSLVKHGSVGSATGATPLSPGDLGAGQRHADLYITELLSYSLERLRKEPELLAGEKDHVKRNIQANAVAYYPAFIHTAKCLEMVSTELSSMAGRLGDLLDAAPRLASACDGFLREATAITARHTGNKQLLGQHTMLLELLEAPQLMDTCVRNGIYDEALDLHAFIARLGLLHPELAIVQALLLQANGVLQYMLVQLLSRLKSAIQLPECLRVIGYLRRMAAFTEPELRMQFLQCREEWLDGLVHELDAGDDSYEYVKHLTDLYRLHLFDIVMQYKAIFFDSGVASGGVCATGAAAPSISSGALRESAVLYSWASHRMACYLEALQAHLPAISEGGNLASVLEHCMYCGASLSRIGLDFTGLLQPIFEHCSLRLFAANLTAAVDKFNTRLEGHKWVLMPPPMFSGSKARPAAATQVVEGADAASPAAGGGDGAADDAFAPPYALMEHLPLAVLTNGALSALNELRHCALAGVAQPMASTLQGALEQAAVSMVHYGHIHVLNDTEAPLFRAAARALGEVVAPYLSTCFSRVFPSGGAGTGPPARVDAAAVKAIIQPIIEE